MNDFQREIYKTIDVLTEQKLKDLGFDKTKRGRVVSINGVECVVQIDGENYTCKLRRGIYVEPNDIVFVKFPQNSSVDKYVETILGGNETPENLVISAEEILQKLKTVDGHGSGLDADTLDGRHGSEYATKEDLDDINVDISGEAIVESINLSTAIIDDKNLSVDVNDAISKKHNHSNKGALDAITQNKVDNWNTVSDKSNIGHKHTETDIIDLDKYTKSETDMKLSTKTDKTYVDNSLSNKVDKITGKQLSTEDFTTIEKTKLSNIEDDANKYILPSATTTKLGGIKVGNNLSITADGTLSVVDDDSKSTFIVKQELFTATEGQTLFNLTKGNYQPNTNTISVYLYGGKQPNISINEISTSSFEIIEPLKAGNIVLVEYIELSSATPYPIHGNDHLTGSYDPIPKATTSSDGLMAKEDKDKLNNIEANANKYTHPATHPYTMITGAPTKLSDFSKDINFDERYYTESEMDTKLHGKVDSSRVLTDVPIGAKFTDTIVDISGKADISYVDSELGGKVDNSRVLTDVPSGAKFTDTIYTHPSNHPASMITESTTKRFVSDTEKSSWNSKAEISDIPTKVGQLQNDKNYVTQSELGEAGLGDMLMSVYDKNGSGIVDNAEKVNGFTVGVDVPANAKFTDTVYTPPSTYPYSMITGTPTSLPASGGQSDTSKGLVGDDTRAINSPPSEYMSGGSRYLGRAGWQTEFKSTAAIGVTAHLGGIYCYVETKNPWSDPSGGYPIQIAYGNGNPIWRIGISATAWDSWKPFSESLHVGTSAPSNDNILWINTNL